MSDLDAGAGGLTRSDEVTSIEVVDGRGEVLEQHRTETSSLMIIAHHECNLSNTIGYAVVATNTDQFIGNRRNQCDPINMINVGEAVQISFREFWIGSEKPQVHGLL